jgi:hypothetical protein
MTQFVCLHLACFTHVLDSSMWENERKWFSIGLLKGGYFIHGRELECEKGYDSKERWKSRSPYVLFEQSCKTSLLLEKEMNSWFSAKMMMLKVFCQEITMSFQNITYSRQRLFFLKGMYPGLSFENSEWNEQLSFRFGTSNS